MAERHRPRDAALIDALEATPPTELEETVWRVVREGREVLQGSSAGGRWDDETFDVLSTSEKADGAVAEMHFHLSRGQLVMPSKGAWHLYELRVTLRHALRFADLAALAALGVDTTRCGLLSYQERAQEYPRPQEIAETACFVGFDGLIVPNARFACLNIVVFCDRVPPEALEVVRDHGAVRWDEWRRQPFGY
jgi:hypothetical protein